MRPRALVSFLIGVALTPLGVACESGGDPAPSVLLPPTSPAASPTPGPREHPPVETVGPDELRDVAKAFLDALAAGRYEDMWELLPSPTQTAWGSRDVFVGFLDRKYGGHEIEYELGVAEESLDDWTEVETGRYYNEVTIVPYGLKVDGQQINEFTLAPLIVTGEPPTTPIPFREVPVDVDLRVAGLGPASRRSPVVTPLPETTASIDMPVLVYHHVTVFQPEDPEQYSITVPANEFEVQLSYMRDEGYKSVTSAEVVNHLYYGLPLPEKPVMITFDDGYSDAYDYALPRLQQYQFFGTFGIVTGFIGSEAYLTWDEVRAMRDAGMEIVSHSVTHPDLGAQTEEEARAELVESKATLEAELGVAVQTLIYPYGEPFAYGTEEAQERIKGILREAGYAAAITNPLPNSYPDIHQDGATPYEFNRLMVSPGMSLERFSARLTGAELQ